MRHRRISWSTALEDASGAGEVLDAPVAEFEINVNEVDEDGAPLEAVDASGQPTVDVTMPETEEALDDVEEAEEVVEKMEETSEVLENYAVAIEQRIRNNGGLTASEWELVQIGLKSRVPHIEALTPGKESFSYSRLSASNEALDAIKQGIQDIWEVIKKAIMSVINRVRKWFIGALSDSARLGKRAKGIAQSAKKKTNVLKDEDGKINLSAKSMIGDDGKLMEREKYVAAAHFYAVLTDEYLVKNGASKTDQVNNLAAGVKLWGDAVTADDTAAGNVKSSLNEYFSNLPEEKENVGNIRVNGLKVDSETESVDGIAVSVKIVKGLPGNTKFVTKIPSIDTTPADTASRVRQYLALIGYKSFETQNTNLRDVDNDVEYKVLSRDQIDAICMSIEGACNNITRFKQDFEKRGQVVDSFVKKMDSYIKELNRKDIVKNNSTLAGYVNAVVQGNSDLVKNSLAKDASFIQEILARSKALLTYAARSVQQYE